MVAPLNIIFENDRLLAINKPHGLLVHRTHLAGDVNHFAMQTLRDQVGYRVYPMHRLDRKTSGVLLFAKDQATCRKIQPMFDARLVEKTYLAVVRGYLPNTGEIDYPLVCSGKRKDAFTKYTTISQHELPFPSHRFATSRYSVVKLFPTTGRYHQLRRHLSHIAHPIIGDRPHGCNKQNAIWLHRFRISELLLHAQQMRFQVDGEVLEISAPISQIFARALRILRGDTS